MDDIVFVKDITRMNLPFSNVKIWAKGEGDELKKWMGFGFYNHLFISEDKNVTLYCDKKECDLFYEFLEKKLNGELFNNLCFEYFKLIDEAKEVCSDEELFFILVRLWPMLTIFQEVSLYPDLVSEEDLSRLIRIRKNTESLVYSLFGRLREEEESSNYYYYRNKVCNEKINLDLLRIKHG